MCSCVRSVLEKKSALFYLSEYYLVLFCVKKCFAIIAVFMLKNHRCFGRKMIFIDVYCIYIYILYIVYYI